MKSKLSFPISERLKKGKFKKPFTSESFKEIYGILIRYHQALNEAEKEIEENNLDYNIDGIFPKEKRLPLDSLCAIFYDKLKEKGLLIFTKERKIEIYDKAVIKYKEQLEAAKRDRKMKFEQKDFDLMVSLLAENKNRPFANLCKKMSLLQYFDELVEMEQDLATLLNNQ